LADSKATCYDTEYRCRSKLSTWTLNIKLWVRHRHSKHPGDTTNDDISALHLGAGTVIGQNAWKGFIAGALLFSSDLSAVIESTIASYYPDVSLDAGKVCVRKYAYPTPTVTSVLNEQPIYSTIAPVMRNSIIQ
jgi:hypothetical protein